MTEGESIVQVMKWLCDGYTLKSASNGCTYAMTDEGLCVRMYEDDGWIRSAIRVSDLPGLCLRMQSRSASKPEQPAAHIRRVEL